MRRKSKARSKFFSAALVRNSLLSHGVIGLVFSSIIYIVCFSGTLSVFHHEFSRWEYPSNPIIGEIKPISYGNAMQLAYARAREIDAVQNILLEPPANGTGRFIVRIFAPSKGVDEKWIADHDGRLLTKKEASWSDFVVDLHARLLVPGMLGAIFVGLIGILIIGLIFSGIAAHPRIFKDAFTLRLGGNARIQEADLHNRLSVWGLPFHLMIALTGTLLALSTLILGGMSMIAFEGDQIKAEHALGVIRIEKNLEKAPILDLEMLMVKYASQFPDFPPQRVFVRDIATKGQNVRINASVPGNLARREQFYYASDGTYLGYSAQSDGKMGQQVIAALGGLHYGWFGGLLLKLGYCVLGGALSFVCVGGVRIWIARRKAQGRPVPVLERIWISSVWAQPTALSVAALVTILPVSTPILTTYFLVVFCFYGAVAYPCSTKSLAKALRIILSVSLFVLVIVHVLVWWSEMNDFVGWAIDGMIIILALLNIRTMFWKSKKLI